MKGYLILSKAAADEDNFDPELTEKLSQSPYFTRYWVSVAEEELQLKAKSDDIELIQRIFFMKLLNIGVISAKFAFYFVGTAQQTFEKNLYLFKSTSEADMRSWVKTVLFMNEACLYLQKPLDFEKFNFKDGVKDFEYMFLKDEISYKYDWVHKKKADEKKRKELNELADKMGVGKANDEGKLNRSVEELSSDSDDEEETTAKKPDPKAKPEAKKEDPKKKDAEKKEEGGMFDGAKKWLNW